MVPQHAAQSFSFWFSDVGWKVENYGTDPDIEVDIAPQDFANNVDPQLERAIAEALRLIEERPSLEAKPGIGRVWSVKIAAGISRYLAI